MQVRREEAKYAFGRELGWRVLGLKAYDASSGATISRGKAFGRTLHPEDIPHSWPTP